MMRDHEPIWYRIGFLGLVFALLLGGGYFLFRSGPGPAPPPTVPDSRSTADPRVTYSGRYRNIHPDVKYVGDDACAACHDDKAETYHHHPMGRSLVPIAEMASPPPIDAAHQNPFSGLGGKLRIDRRANETTHTEYRVDAVGNSLYEFSLPVKYAIGSGTHAQSYLWEQDGYVKQSAVTWFGQKQIWSASPGFKEVGGGRPIEGRCLFCHSNRVEVRPEYSTRFAEPLFRGHAIGCERCHGPGEKHVARWGGRDPVDGPDDFTIVNPRRLPWPLREAVCRQCHSEGETRQVKRGRGLFDFRPGLPLEDFWIIAVRAAGEEEFKVINHVEQIERSSCFQKSSDANKLGCISCHDPHVKPAGAARQVHFRQACLNCHSKQGCALPEAERLAKQPQDSCIDCHMPKSATQEIPHISGTDHRIMRRPTPFVEDQTHELHAPDGALPIRLLHRRPGESLAPEERRDLGVVLAELINDKKVAIEHAGRTLELLEEALQTVPDDAQAWEARAQVLLRLERVTDAYAAFQESLRLEPNRESSLEGAALIAMQLGRKDEAIDLWKRSVERNPHRTLPHASLALLYASRLQWLEGKPHCDTWVRLEPGIVQARRLRTLYLLRLNEREAAVREFAILEALHPPNLAEIRAWWNAETGQPKLPARPLSP